MNEKLYLDLHSFQGPFDLLLHLIKEMEIDIHDIPMTEITDQYMQFIHAMYPLDLDVLGDYLVMAASLIEIKTKLLLPVEIQETEVEVEDPREHLVQHLLLYQQFQSVAEDFLELEAQRAMQYAKEPSDLSAYQEFIPLKEGAVTKEQLAQAFQQALLQAQERLPKQREIEQDTLTVEEQVTHIKEYFNKRKQKRPIEFTQLLQISSRAEIITTFMAMLELVSKNYLHFQQDERMGPILLKWIGGH